MKIPKATIELAREISLKKHKEWNKGRKANLWVCGNLKLGSSKKVQCDECGRDCYQDTKMKHVMTKNHTIMCLYCAYECDEITIEQKDIIGSIINK